MFSPRSASAWIMPFTQWTEVVLVGDAFVVPGGDVVDVAPVRRPSAAGRLTFFVAGLDERFLLGGGPVVQPALMHHLAGVGEGETPHRKRLQAVRDLAGDVGHH